MGGQQKTLDQPVIPINHLLLVHRCVHPIFYKKLGSAHSTKRFLLWHDSFAILVLHVSYLDS